MEQPDYVIFAMFQEISNWTPWRATYVLIVARSVLHYSTTIYTSPLPIRHMIWRRQADGYPQATLQPALIV